ncbi:MAG TPA: sigma-54 dependent transcriptional regulator [Candidatus Binatia bacterium]|jgi:DNA-binding NtrC family response regulator|nr:sigma-54 dependent transcriptional regulator [Candidatus Binatia bacterium]
MVRSRQTVLVVDDDAATRQGLMTLLDSWGYQPSEASDGKAALKLCEKELPQAIITDLMMPGMNGLEFIGALGERIQQIAIIFVTGQATIDTAVQAIKLGAYDYLPKPLEPQRFHEALEKGLKQVSLTREAGALRQRLESPLGSYGALIGKSAPMRRLYQQIGQIAATSAAVLVSGESGTGKELVARTLHDLSPRREEEFLALNCAAISPTLMESELFGHEKGAFTSAVDRHLGCFEQADGGTLFLDEITEMAPEIQPKFLRVLEEGQIRRIGGAKNISVSVRVVAATNRQPAAAVKDGKLRQDLFYRLNVFHLELPSLRERGDDITLLAGYFLESFATKYQKNVVPWAADFAPALMAHDWPGNVRELRNAMERLTVLAAEQTLSAKDFQLYCLSAVVEEQSDRAPISLAEAERQAIERALTATGGNKTQAAQLLGITPKTLNAKLALYSKE